MPKSVNAAFNTFLSQHVNLDPVVTSTARASRDWLIKQIKSLPTKNSDFPVLCSDFDLHYGSFARRTKIRELDDLDLIVGISALGTTYQDYNDTIVLTVPDGIALRNFCHDGTNWLNSRRVIDKFVKHLNDVPQYENAEIGRRNCAAVLNLSSYSWSFDIVPGFFTAPEFNGRSYYLIPDGQGHWRRTDPRIDQSNTTMINQEHDGYVLNVIRLIKYWNRWGTMPTMQSYLLECIILNYYRGRTHKASSFVDLEVAPVLDYLAGAIYLGVQDPKGIQGDINYLDWNSRTAISSRAALDAENARTARSAESVDDEELSINTWRRVFGEAFPQYG